MNAETAPLPTPDDEHIVPDAEHEANNTLSLSREAMRDRDAIKVFISTRDRELKAGKTLEEAANEGALKYDAILDTPLAHWGPEPAGPEPSAPRNAGSAGVYDTAEIGLTKVEPSNDFLNAIAERRAEALEDIRLEYKIEKAEIQKTAVENSYAPQELKAELEKLDDEYVTKFISVKNKYGSPQAQEARTINETKDYTTKEQIDALTPAVEAAYNIRQESLAEGKTLDQAYDLGAIEYQKVIEAMDIKEGKVKPKLKPEDLHEDLAIKAFNKSRDIVIPKSMRHGKNERGLVLHRAAGFYKETSTHLEHSAHENSEHDDDPQNGSPETPPPPSDPEKKNALRMKVKGVFGKIGNVIVREREVIKKTGVQDYLASYVESFKVLQNQKHAEGKTEKASPDRVSRFKSFKAIASEKFFDTTWLGKRYIAAQIRRDQRLADIAEDIKRRVKTVEEDNLTIGWRLDGKDLIKDIRQFNADVARSKADAGKRLAEQQAQTGFDETSEEARARTKAEEKQATIEASEKDKES